MTAIDKLIKFCKEHTPPEHFEAVCKKHALMLAEDCSNRLPWGRHTEFKRLYREAENE